ncbi:Nramp family divalent metal transporter [Rubinisphaera margarita]|uniref:Nramp family divalent metal transporter n=1 Tax=Rubinisphaera margarita TaxID=2909586 RepID=UPI001EE82FE9|nr:Nramp family divalent metal transporter [Rubinisphaera margarita]MCG6156684.1 Nramp family divalent metal transporter [Rubinisphaera margarita]
MQRLLGKLKIIGPGILVAATGVGAGDLATGALTGSILGTVVLWAVLVGALFKFALNEGLTRWQLATGTTLLEGCIRHFGWLFLIGFLFYLLLWSFFVASALMSACGVVMHAIWPVFGSPESDKFYWGILHSLLAVGLIWTGGYRTFERVMLVCIGLMFVTVTATAIIVRPDLSAMLNGMFVPTIPDFNGAGLTWTIALIGGVGGTLTILCYGYWIREVGRCSLDDLPNCRIDIAAGYLMTAIFGMAMVVIGSRIQLDEGSPARTIVLLADELRTSLGSFGPAAMWIFLIGAWGAVASSLLGVWQSVPYLFADVYESLTARIGKRERRAVSTSSRPYRIYLLGLALLPMLALTNDFKTLQKLYAVFGALVIPLLAIILLILGNWSKAIGSHCRNPLWSNIVLTLALLFFCAAGYLAFIPPKMQPNKASFDSTVNELNIAECVDCPSPSP